MIIEDFMIVNFKTCKYKLVRISTLIKKKFAKIL